MAARRVLRMAGVCAVLAVAAAAAAAPAAAPLAARVDGEPVYAATVDTLWQQRRAAKPSLKRSEVLDDVIVSRLLAARAAAAGPRSQASGMTVAFAPDVLVEQRLVAALREVYGKDIDAAVKGLRGGTPESLVVSQPPIPKAQLEAIFGRPGPMLLEIALTDAQQAQAATIEVLRYQLPGASPASITLYDVYHRQNVQGRLALSQQPAGVAARQARRILADAFVLDWAKQRFGAEAVADMRKAMMDGESVLTIQLEHGVGLDTDAGSALLNRLSKESSPEEIERYYKLHKEQFVRIEKVRARHIRLADEAQARRAVKALQGGAGFAATARSMSAAADAAQGGDLGWIKAGEGKDWLASLAFSQEPGKPSAAIRAPVGPNEAAYWEIVLVEERVQGVHPPDSETVRYQASRMIAQYKAMRQLMEMFDQVRASAHIEILEPK